MNNLTTLTLNNGLTTIGSMAFRYAKKLTSLTIPSTATSIAAYAFADLDALTSLTINEGITTITNNVFYLSTKFLSSITIPNSVTSIGESAFRYDSTGEPYSNITSVTLGSGLITVGDFAFSNVLRSVETFVIPNNVQVVGDRAFYNSNTSNQVTLHTVTVGSGLTTKTGTSLFGSQDKICTVTNLSIFTNSGLGINTNANCPAAPRQATAVAISRGAIVTVSAPLSGGTPTSYLVTASPGGETCTVTGASGSCTVSNLTNGTAYTFTTQSINALGTSSASVASTAVTPDDIPQTISALDISSDTGSSSSDFNTSTASQTITGTLSYALETNDKIFGSLDGGSNYVDITSYVTGTTISWPATLTTSGTIALRATKAS
jgi:K+-transporting ATPase c subunit